MSSVAGDTDLRARFAALWAALQPSDLLRAGALAATLVLISSFTLVLYEIIATVGDPTGFVLVVFGAGSVATVVWPFVDVDRAVRVGVAAFVAGLLLYGLAIPVALRPLPALKTTVELLTGRSTLWLIQVDLWVLLVTPAPVFLTWLFALDGRYVRAAGVGGAAICFLTLTGDATLTPTLLGVVAAGALVGLGDVMRRADSILPVESLVVVLAVMIVAPFLVSVVPGGAAGPLGLVGDDAVTMEENVVEAGPSLEIRGSIEQTADVRFLASGDQPRYWRTGSYDRYTGDGWIRTGESDNGLEPPDDADRVANYTVEPRTEVRALPAPWRPVSFDGVDDLSVTPDGTPTPGGTVEQEYTVTSTVPDASAVELSLADGEFPADVVDRYTQLPADTPDRVAQRTQSIAANAATPYETAAVVEAWLENNREYSLDVDRPSGNIADAFLFEMEAGYCTYYATTMVSMLRSVDIPARLVVGYTPGEQVDSDTWAVRGTNSHAWVEVYVPEHGWVQFDPTPADPRTDAESQAFGGSGTNTGVDLSGTSSGEAPDVNRADSTPDTPEEESATTGESVIGSVGAPNIDTDRRFDTTGSPGPSGNDTRTVVGELEDAGDTDTDVESESDDGISVAVSPGDISPRRGSDALLELPAYQHALLATLALAGLAIGVRRSPLPALLEREVRIRFQRRHDPETDVERAHDRMLLVLGKRHRVRDSAETTRQYLDAVGACPEAHRLAAIRERTRYADECSEAAADEAVELVGEVRRG